MKRAFRIAGVGPIVVGELIRRSKEVALRIAVFLRPGATASR